jgi:hypothetical protein
MGKQASGILLLLCFLCFDTVQAGEATMLPAGISRIRLYVTYAEADSVFDNDGNEQSFSQIYDQALLDNAVPVDGGAAYQIDTGGALTQWRSDLYFEYGLTDNFGYGAWIQYLDTRNSADATLIQGPGWSTLSPGQQAALTGATRTVDGLDRSASALGDTVIGLKHRLLGNNKSKYRFAYHAGIRLPTGHVADPLDPHDLSTGDGQVDVGLWWTFDYQPTPDFFVNLQTRHEYQFEGKRDMLDPQDPTRSMEARFQPGFYNYAEIEAKYYHPLREARLVFKLTSTWFNEDEERRQSYDSNTGRYSGSLNTVDGTDSSLWTVQPHIGFNLLRMGIPIEALLSYSRPLGGSNTPAAEFVQLRLDLYY